MQNFIPIFILLYNIYNSSKSIELKKGLISDFRYKLKDIYNTHKLNLFHTKEKGKNSLYFNEQAMPTIKDFINARDEIADTIRIIYDEIPGFTIFKEDITISISLSPETIPEIVLKELEKELLKELDVKQIEDIDIIDRKRIDYLFNNNLLLKYYVISHYKPQLTITLDYCNEVMVNAKLLLLNFDTNEPSEIDLQAYFQSLDTKIDHLNFLFNLLEKTCDKSMASMSTISEIDEKEKEKEKLKTESTKEIMFDNKCNNIQTLLATYTENIDDINITIKSAIKNNNSKMQGFNQDIHNKIKPVYNVKTVNFSIYNYNDLIQQNLNKNENKENVMNTENIKQITEKEEENEKLKSVKFDKETEIEIKQKEKNILELITLIYEKNIIYLKEFVYDLDLFIDKYQTEIKLGFYIHFFDKLVKDLEKELDNIKLNQET
eukprot:GAHX01001245.1.p1 GENE.GAHX01001245.1~~GAHX01001245.1.p1  ORF type:complete len:434 (+),score=124.81 GAHX01001245.1:182-1483(+)